MKTWTSVVYVIKIKPRKCKHMHSLLLKVTPQFPNCALNALRVRLLRSPLMGQSLHFISVISSLCIPTNTQYSSLSQFTSSLLHHHYTMTCSSTDKQKMSNNKQTNICNSFLLCDNQLKCLHFLTHHFGSKVPMS